MRCANDKMKIKELTEQDEAFGELEEDAYDMIAEYANSTVFKNLKKKYKKGDKVDMCKGLRDWMEEERLIGLECGVKAFIEDKIEDGVPEDRIISKLVMRFQMEPEKADEYYKKYRELH